jgi:hypothetical protein
MSFCNWRGHVALPALGYATLLLEVNRFWRKKEPGVVVEDDEEGTSKNERKK